MACGERPLNHGCTVRRSERVSELDWERFIEAFDPVMTGMCGRLWRRGNCARTRNPDGTNFRGAWWDLPCGVYVCVGPERSHFYAYDPVRDVAVSLNAGWTREKIEGVLDEIIEHAERGE